MRTPAGGSDADISGAISQTYVPVFADAGATLKVRVEVTDDEGHQATFTSAATSAVAATLRPLVTVVSDGDVTEGDTVTFTLTRTGDPAGTLDVAYAVAATGDFGAATGADTATFLANSATVQVSVATTGDSTHEAHGSMTLTLTLTADTGTDPAYLPGAPSAATAAVRDDDDSPATGTVTITGTPTEGETLTADTSGLTDADGLDNAAWGLPVGADAGRRQWRGHFGRDLADLHAGVRGWGDDAQGPGGGHRRRGPRGDLHERGDGGGAALGDGGAEKDPGERRGPRRGVHDHANRRHDRGAAGEDQRVGDGRHGFGRQQGGEDAHDPGRPAPGGDTRCRPSWTAFTKRTAW